ncbi:MAG: hypothetical protein ACJA0H_001000 [Francisellaceae bacterium]|jgi:hypothetical protein
MLIMAIGITISCWLKVSTTGALAKTAHADVAENRTIVPIKNII